MQAFLIPDMTCLIGEWAGYASLNFPQISRGVVQHCVFLLPLMSFSDENFAWTLFRNSVSEYFPRVLVWGFGGGQVMVRKLLHWTLFNLVSLWCFIPHTQKCEKVPRDNAHA